MLLVPTALLTAAQTDPLVTTQLILALLCVIVASSLALGVTVGLARRIQTIADQHPPAQVPTDQQPSLDEKPSRPDH